MKVKMKKRSSHSFPFDRIVAALSLNLTQTMKQYGDAFGEALTEALKLTNNYCMVALDNGEPVLITGGEAVNYCISLDSIEALALFAKAARCAGVSGLTKRDLVSAIDVVKFAAIMSGYEAQISLFNQYLNDDFPAEGVVLNTHSCDGTALSITNNSVNVISAPTEATFKWAPRSGGLTYVENSSSTNTPAELHKLFSNLSYKKFMLAMAYAGFILEPVNNSV